ncbi:hypothetical protein I4U23_003656 [Adineta vaga]|nr:hypothetical protein I4U23_003656 [Adineta vaga]
MALNMRSSLRSLGIEENYQINSLELLPNELLFMIISYLNSIDVVQAFCVPKRFWINLIKLLRVLSKLSILMWKLLPQFFLSTDSYVNLHSIILRCSNFATIDLNVDRDSIQHALHSCLDVLCTFAIFFPTMKMIIRNIKFTLNRFVSSAMNRLCVESCSEKALLLLCAFTPNLMYLKVRQLVSADDDSDCDPMLMSTPSSSTLKQLHITATTKRLNDIQTIERIINHYQDSLEYLTPEISLNKSLDGYYLQGIFEPCQHLKQFSFAFNYWHDETEEISNILHQFQSNWWLDALRPPILIFCDNHRETSIFSMPCHLDDYIWFPSDPQDWLLNKGHISLFDVCFTKQKYLRFINHNRQPLTLDLVNIIGHIFRASQQELSILHCSFVSSNLLLEQLIIERSKDPMLPLVSVLDLNTCNLDQLDAKTLITWLLLASNVKMINICQGNISAKIRLINQLKSLLKEDKRLKSVTDAIEEIRVFYMFDSLNYATKQHICQMYSDVFRKPVIRR